MSRKTVNVAALVRRGNIFLANSDDSQVGERRGVASMIEQALFMADSYKGFRYITHADRASGEMDATRNCSSVGIERPDGPDTAPIFPDESRRQYNIPRS